MKNLELNRFDNVSIYKELLELFLENNPDFLKTLTKDELIGLDHVLDFENYVFLVINYNMVAVVVDGMIASLESMEEFIESTKELIDEAA